jgi:hypothetical protein
MIIAIILMLLSLGLMGYNLYVVDVKVLDISFKVDDVIGINVSNKSLNFGRSPPETAMKRYINLSNNYNFPIEINIKMSGEISEYVSVSDNNFEIIPGDKKEVTFLLRIPKDIEYRYFIGKSRVVFKRKL